MTHGSEAVLYQTILYVTLILLFAKLFGELAERIGQPPVLGELLAGVLLGSSLMGYAGLHDSRALLVNNETLLFLSQLGAILLLFEIGLESDIEEFLRVGPSSLVVAIVGVIGPFVLGYFASKFLGLSTNVSIFIGATFTATSVGITARTMSDLGRLRTPEAQIILGAAVIDDVLGLIILAVVSGLVLTGTVSAWSITKITILAIVFLVGSVLVGIPIAPHVLRVTKKLRTRGVLTISAILFCLTLSFLAHKLQLATIVGAFAAGLVLARTQDQAHICERVKPIADIFIPIFFVMLGVQVQLGALSPSSAEGRTTLALAGILAFIAVVTKILAGIGVLKRGTNRLLVGVGMIPRGEVGFIFASLGLARNIITPGEYAGIIAVVIFTTFITPPLLKLVIARERSLPYK